MDDCIFCKIVKGDIPSTKVYEDDMTLAFNDISPKAPLHVVVIPKKHVANILEAAKDKELMAAVTNAVCEVAKILDVDKNGFRTVANTGHDGGQSVDHFHFHVLAGKVFGENFG
jgi:histidine triad (HIT) family protein